MKSLVLWSGGVESTSLLKHLLTDTDEQIVAHHIVSINPEGRAQHEIDAIRQLLPKLQEIRPFEFSVSQYSICEGKALPWDYAIQLTMGAAAMNHYGCERIYRALCLEDNYPSTTQFDGTVTYKVAGPTLSAVHDERSQILKYSIRADQRVEDVSPWVKHYEHSKGWHIRYLGDLFPLTWSCRRPVEGRVCGKCHTCLNIEAGLRGTSSVPEIAQMIQDAVIE